MDFSTSAKKLVKQMDKCIAVYNEMVDVMNELRECADGFDRMKNCVNCDHYGVCAVVHDRKRRQAGDYTPCSKWKLVEK